MDNKTVKNRTEIVILITLLMMVAEIFYGITSHSMGLLADGIHMGTHALAFIVTLVICIIIQKHQDKSTKLNALGGYTSSILLGLTSLGLIWESISRFFNPLSISFNEAIFVAAIGLIVNILCIFIMGGEEIHFNKCCLECEEHKHKDKNLNFMAAYMHIVADAFTSVLAIIALFCGKFLGLVFLDPFIGILGGIIIGKWAFNLMSSSSKILIDLE
ncbi:cation transporter [bacterium]|nr:cation transporter [bacterium]